MMVCPEGWAWNDYSQQCEPLLRGAVVGPSLDWIDHCDDARAQLAALDPRWATSDCETIRITIWGDCTLFPFTTPDDAGSQIGVAARCVDGLWTGLCPQPPGLFCKPASFGSPCPDCPPCQPGQPCESCPPCPGVPSATSPLVTLGISAALVAVGHIVGGLLEGHDAG